MLLAEANQWPEDAAEYFGDGDECQMAFHFPIMPRLFIAVRMEDRFPIIDSLEQTPNIPENCQWAIFLRNHDELTLEMVTDEERDYMYRVYAQEKQARINVGIRRRLAPLMENNRRKIELMKSLLFSLPGAPVIYYGDEIGMGDNIYLGDRNGVRTPMQWSADRNAGFSRANPQSLYLPPIIDQEYHYEALNVETQQNNPSSLLWWTKRFIGLRKNFKSLSRGSIEFLFPENRKVLAFIRKYENETVLIVANLSRFVQYAELDLGPYRGMAPVEVFGRNEFPVISDKYYFLTLGPHSFMWFSLESQTDGDGSVSNKDRQAHLSLLRVEDNWKTLFQKEKRARLEKRLPDFVADQRWFRSKTRQIRSVSIREALKPKNTLSDALITILEVEFKEGDPETYLLPLMYSTAEKADEFFREHPQAILCRLNVKKGDQSGVIHDATIDPDFGMDLFDLISSQKTLKGVHGSLGGKTTKSFKRIPKRDYQQLSPHLLKGEQSNTSMSYGDRYILKIYRRLDEGINPEQEMGRFFERKKATFTAKLSGFLDYKVGRKEPSTVAILNEYISNQGDAWEYTLDELSRYFEEVLAKRPQVGEYSSSSATILESSYGEIPHMAQELIGSYIESAKLLGARTGEMHLTLASERQDPDFTPEEFTTLYQRSLYQSLRNLTTNVFQTLKRKIKDIPEEVRPDASMILERKSEIMDLFKKVTSGKFDALRIRCHGDYHLGQVLYTGNDFVIMDFEGEPARSLGDRKVKRAPLRDVAGMLRSFHYAVNVAMFGQRELGMIHDDDLGYFHQLGSFWNYWVSAAYTKEYLATLGISPLIPESHEEFQTMLDIFVLEKAVYELGYELNNRPGWIKIPVDGMRYILGEAP
jgi:maltose alpha-D-glucosyltransferase/alpha-amylase